MREAWKDIVGYEGLYQVSDIGRIKSLERVRINGRKWKTRILKFKINKNGYHFVNLYKNGKGKSFYIHRLVLITFIGICPEDMEACHSNGDKTDNRLSNLRYDTKSNNMLDAVKHGTHHKTLGQTWTRGEGCGTSKLTTKQVLEIRYLYETGKYIQKELAKKFDVCRPQISRIINKKTWAHT
jgi:hypothetical protein